MTPDLRRLTFAGVLTAALAACALAATESSRAVDRLPVGREPVALDPADVSTKIDNPYYPLTPGDRRVYRKTALDGEVTRSWNSSRSGRNSSPTASVLASSTWSTA